MQTSANDHLDEPEADPIYRPPNESGAATTVIAYASQQNALIGKDFERDGS